LIKALSAVGRSDGAYRDAGAAPVRRAPAREPDDRRNCPGSSFSEGDIVRAETRESVSTDAAADIEVLIGQLD
jgi:hypothetical protein